MVKTKLACTPIGVVGLSFILILKTSLEVRRKSPSNKRKLFFRPRGVSVTRDKDVF